MNKFFRTKNLYVFDAFCGYGAQNLALKLIAKQCSGLKIKVVGVAEIDPFADKAYHVLHGKRIKNYGDISKIQWHQVPDFNLFFYSFPCTDISISGNQKGLTEGSGTSSSLIWECLKGIKAKRPQLLILENVANLQNKKFEEDFNLWKDTLNEQGYDNYYQVLNAKDFGVPQNRARCFMVSILREETKDTGESESTSYVFPKPEPLKIKAEALLERKVDDSYYFNLAA